MQDRYSIYVDVKSPIHGFQEKTRVISSDQSGFKNQYIGYQTAVVVVFDCNQAETVSKLVDLIEKTARGDDLEIAIGYHVIGWAIHRWTKRHVSIKHLSR